MKGIKSYIEKHETKSFELYELFLMTFLNNLSVFQTNLDDIFFLIQYILINGKLTRNEL